MMVSMDVLSLLTYKKPLTPSTTQFYYLSSISMAFVAKLLIGFALFFLIERNLFQSLVKTLNQNLCNMGSHKALFLVLCSFFFMWMIYILHLDMPWSTFLLMMLCYFFRRISKTDFQTSQYWFKTLNKLAECKQNIFEYQQDWAHDLSSIQKENRLRPKNQNQW